MRAILVVVAVCGPSARAPNADPGPPPWHFACEGDFEREPEPLRIELTPITLHAVRGGPRVSQRSRAGHARALPQLEEALSRLEAPMRRCWQWAASRNAPDVTANISFTVTPFGALEAFAVATPDGRAPELVACLQDVLGNAWIDEESARTTRMHARVAFVHVEHESAGVPRRPDSSLRARETAARASRARTCISVLDDASPDVVESPLVYTVDDGGPVEEFPGSLPDCMRLQRLPSDAAIAGAFTANLGAFEACYADALARNLERQVHTQRRVPPLDGLFELRVVLSGLGKPRVVDVQGPGGGELYQCMTKAASEIWLADRPSRAPIEAVVRFTLTPTTTVAPIDIAKHERALASASGAVQHCQARADLVFALAVQRPWLDDARLIAETRALTREAVALPEPKLCVERADKLLEGIAGDFGFDRSEFSWSRLDRIEAVLPIADHVEWGFALRWYHASTIAMLPERNAEGIGILRALAQSDSLAGALAEGELSRYEPPHPITPAACD